MFIRVTDWQDREYNLNLNHIIAYGWLDAPEGNLNSFVSSSVFKGSGEYTTLKVVETPRELDTRIRQAQFAARNSDINTPSVQPLMMENKKAASG